MIAYLVLCVFIAVAFAAFIGCCAFLLGFLWAASPSAAIILGLIAAGALVAWRTR